MDLHDFSPEDGQVVDEGMKAWNALDHEDKGASSSRTWGLALAVPAGAAFLQGFRRGGPGHRSGLCANSGEQGFAPLETSPDADGYDKAASWFSTFGPKYFAFPCFKAFNSIASSVLQKVSIEAKKFREAEGFEQEIWLARKTVVELKTIMGEYSFLKDTSTPAAEARMQKLENARNVVEKAMSRVSCAAEQLEGFVATQIAQSDEDARKADEEKGLALLQKYNNDS